MSLVVLTGLPAAASHCIGCPSGGGSSAPVIVLGVVLVIIGIAAMALSQRRDRQERQGTTGPRAASLLVTIGRALGLLLILIGLLTAILRP